MLIIGSQVGHDRKTISSNCLLRCRSLRRASLQRESAFFAFVHYCSVTHFCSSVLVVRLVVGSLLLTTAMLLTWLTSIIRCLRLIGLFIVRISPSIALRQYVTFTYQMVDMIFHGLEKPYHVQHLKQWISASPIHLYRRDRGHRDASISFNEFNMEQHLLRAQFKRLKEMLAAYSATLIIDVFVTDVASRYPSVSSNVKPKATVF